MTTPWRTLADAVNGRYARSWWRLPLVTLVAATVSLGPLWLLRGPRLVTFACAGVVAAVGGAVCFAHPFQTLLAVLFFSYSGLAQFFPGPFVTALLAVTVVRLVFDDLAGRGPIRWLPRSRVHRTAFAVLLACILTSLLAVHDWRVAAIEFRQIALGMAMAFAIARLCDRPERVLAACVAVAAGVAIATLWTLRALVLGGGSAILELAAGVRLGGLGADPNLQAANAVTCVAAVILGIGAVRRGSLRAGMVVVAFLLVVAVVLTQSRGGVLVLAAVLTWLVVRVRRGRPYAFATLAAAAIVAAMLPSVYWVRFQSIAQFSGIVVDRSLQLRQHALEGALRTALEHPWIGVGLGNLSFHAPSYMLGKYLAHNTYVELAASIGIVGALAWMTWYATAITASAGAARRLRAAGQRNQAMIADGVVIGQIALAATMMLLSMPFFLIVWFAIGLGVALDRCGRDELSA